MSAKSTYGIVTAFVIPGYQEVQVERDSNQTTYLWIGDQYVAFTPAQWNFFVGSLSLTGFDGVYPEAIEGVSPEPTV